MGRSTSKVGTGCWLAVVAIMVVAPIDARAKNPTHTIRFATVAPRGSAWALEFEAMGREIETKTDGDVKVKFYYGGVAGNELEVHERIRRGQLDATASGGMLCNRVMPSARVLMLLGVFQSREEAMYVANELGPTLREEARDSGYELLAMAGIGPIVIFSKEPIDSMKALRRAKAFRWKYDDVSIEMMKEMGLTPVGLALNDVADAYDDGRIDVITTPPMAALAFQWYTKARYLTDLRVGYLMGCVLLSDHALDELSPESRQVVRSAMAKLGIRIEEIGTKQDEELLGTIYKHQGLKIVKVSRKFRSEFFATAREAREKLGDDTVPRGLVDRVMGLLADFRAEHPADD